MRVLRYICIFSILILLAGSVTPVFAQAYRFQMTEEATIVTINVDGSISIDYTMKFINDSNAHVIDIVDIGLPNYDYDLKSITAEIDGKPVKKITASDIVQPGISLYLQSNEIPAGGTGVVHTYIGVVKNVIYPATQTEAESYASLVFSPHYYFPDNDYGNTKYQATLVLPPGVKDTEARYFVPTNWPGPNQPESKILDNGRIFYTWYSEQANGYTEYKFGTSFPGRVLNDGAIVTAPYVPPSSTGNTSGSKFSLDSLCPFIFCIGFIGFFVLIIYSATIGAKKRKLQYLPPKISMEGHGIKRGLTAVETAVLMEQPMDKIFTMILFSLLKKNAAQVVTKDPLDISPAVPLPADLYGYETDFLTGFAEKQAAPRRKLLQTLMVNLIQTVGEKMKGFSRKETLAFYEDIMKRAWTQVETANTPEVKAQVYEEVMDWTMLDKKYEDRTRDVFSGPMIVPTPMWWWRYDPSVARPAATTISQTTPPSFAPSMGKGISMPSMPGSSFAASVVNSVSSFSSKVMGGLPGFTSGVTSVTNPPPPPSTYRSSGGGSSGGHSCACACACAGCACACAGGGR
jgi:hypothetical protein